MLFSLKWGVIQDWVLDSIGNMALAMAVERFVKPDRLDQGTYITIQRNIGA